jgi:hypothetical protein
MGLYRRLYSDPTALDDMGGAPEIGSLGLKAGSPGQAGHVPTKILASTYKNHARVATMRLGWISCGEICWRGWRFRGPACQGQRSYHGVDMKLRTGGSLHTVCESRPNLDMQSVIGNYPCPIQRSTLENGARTRTVVLTQPPASYIDRYMTPST